MENNTAPTLFELVQATRDDGLVGEANTALTFYMATTNGGLQLFEGPAGSGKDQVIHSVMYLIDDPDKIEENESDLVWYWASSSSAKAPFYRSKELNQCPVHIIPDQVAVNPDFEMIVKSLAEGRPATHEKVDVTLSDEFGAENQLADMQIDVPRCIAMSIASDNERIDMKDLAEMDSRAFTHTPDASEEQTRAINTRQVEIRDGTYERRVDAGRLQEIRDYYRTIPVKKYTDSNAGKILNLTMAGIQEQEPLPPKFVKARRDLPRLMDFIDAVALYHHADRMEVKSEYPQKLLVAPADAWYGFKIFGEELVMSALNLRPLDRKILEFMRSRPNKKYSAMDLQAEMQDEKYGENRAVTEIRKALDNMIHKMYVQRHEDNPVSFSASPFGQSIDVAQQAKLDWQLVVDRAKEKAIDNLENEEDAEQYISGFCEGDGLLCTHPVSGEVVNILEDTEFEDALDEAQDEIDNEFGEGLWDGPVGDESSENVAADGGESSGTL